MVRCMALSLTSACRVLAPGARLKNEHMSTSSLTLWIPYWISSWCCEVGSRWYMPCRAVQRAEREIEERNAREREEEEERMSTLGHLSTLVLRYRMPCVVSTRNPYLLHPAQASRQAQSSTCTYLTFSSHNKRAPTGLYPSNFSAWSACTP